MPLTAADTRSQLADTARNPRRTVTGGDQVIVRLSFEGEFHPEDIFDALATKYRTSHELTTALAGTNNDLLFNQRSVAMGDPTPVTIAYVVAGNNTPLTVAVVGRAITVNVATDGGGAATSTAAQVRDAINSNTAAAGLVFASNAAGNDGTGVVTALAATALAGGVVKVTAATDTIGQREFHLRIAA